MTRLRFGDEAKVTTVNTVHHGRLSTRANIFLCTADDCERDAVMAVLVNGEFDGHAYCRRRGHRSEVIAVAELICTEDAT